MLAKRHSRRAYDPDKPIADDVLTGLLEAARWAPSCYNQQPWHFLVFDRFRNPESFQSALACLTESNQRWASRAAVLIAVATDHATLLSNGDANDWAEYDAGAAGLSLFLQAFAMNLGSNQIAGFDAQAAHAAFDLPDEIHLVSMIAVGHPGDMAHLKDWQQAIETGPRERRPLDEIAHDGAWKTPFRR